MSAIVEIEARLQVHSSGATHGADSQAFSFRLDGESGPLRDALISEGWTPPGQPPAERSPFTLQWERIGPRSWRARGLNGGTYFVRQDRWLRADVRFNRDAGPYALSARQTVEGCMTAAEEHHARLMMDAVSELVIAGRIVAFEDQGQDALRRLDKATEAFASTVPWEDQPEEEATE